MVWPARLSPRQASMRVEMAQVLCSSRAITAADLNEEGVSACPKVLLPQQPNWYASEPANEVDAVIYFTAQV